MRTLLVLALFPGCFPLCPAGQEPSPEGDRCVWIVNDAETDGGADLGNDASDLWRDAAIDMPVDLRRDAEADMPVDLGTDAGPPCSTTWACGITSIQTPSSNNCVLFDSGRVACWGWNYYGQHGAGHRDETIYPEYVNDIPPALELAVGYLHACVRTVDGVWCWGYNDHGQVDPSSTQESFATPVKVHGPVQKIAAGNTHTCVLDDVGDAYCWGSNSMGEFGNGSSLTSAPAITPVDLTFAADNLWAAGTRTCYGDRITHRVYCTGYPLVTDGIVGTSPVEPTRIVGTYPPVTGHSMANVTQNSSYYNACGIERDSGQVLCWGELLEGYTDTLPPTGTTADMISVSNALTAWISGGAVSFAGAGDVASHYEPLTGLTDVALISLGVQYGCYLQGGHLYCWGRNYMGNLGNGSPDSSTPVEVLEPVE